jgi:hypothetical protein
MAFTTGTDFTAPSTFTAGTDFHHAASSTGAIACALPGPGGGFVGSSGAAAGILLAMLPGPSGAFSGISELSGIFTTGTDFTVADLAVFTTGNNLYFSTPRVGVISAQLSGPSSGFVGHNEINEAAFAALLPGPTVLFAGHYAHNVPRYMTAGFSSPLENAVPQLADHRLGYDRAVWASAECRAMGGAGSPLPVRLQAPVDQNAPLPLALCVAVDATRPLLRNNRITSERMMPLPLALCGAADDATPMGNGFAAVMDALEQLGRATCYPVEDTGKASHESTFVEVILTPNPGPYGFTAGLDFAVDPARGFTRGTAPFPYTEADITYRAALWRGVLTHETCAIRQQAIRAKRHQCSTMQDTRRPPPGTSVPVDPPPPPPPPPPDPHETLTIPIQSVYTMLHTISVVTLAGNIPIPMSALSLSLNADAYAWQFSGTLTDPSALALVQIVDNEPVTLAVTIEGYLWHVIVEEIEHSREFGKQSITLKGRSLSALLGAPYQQPTSATYGAPLTVQQLAELQLPIGWTLNWEQVTWLVAGGAWSYTNQSPIQALAGIAFDTGSMLIPARSDQSLTMKPRYPYWPWDFAGATPDLIIPEAAIKTVSLRPRLGTQANGVYVHGGDVGGVLGWCRFNGTDGARLAQTVNNNLMTDMIGCRALGSRILAGQYTQPIVKNLTTYLDGDVFPLAEIGMLASVGLGAEDVRGIINSVSVDVRSDEKNLTVSQTLQIGEETPNAWALFKELLPRDPLLVGALASTNGATAVITLLDGGVITVRGTGTVGQKYYIRSGRIEGEAPAMVQQEIVV